MLARILLVLWTISLNIQHLALAAPTLQNPLMAQQPPVARINQPFVFNVLSGTFKSDKQITYTTSQLPKWLSWNEPSLAFYGTPSDSDQGEQDITLTADDGSGSVASNFTLIVSKYAMPGVHQAFTTQVGDPSSRVFASATALPGGTGVSIPPHWSFSLGWAPDTFRLSHDKPTNGNLFMAARIRGQGGLPPWLRFNNQTMVFDGVSPPSGCYTVVVTGTDYWGYQGAQTSFVIEVGKGDTVELSKGSNFTDIQTMARENVNYQVDVSDILVNGKTATQDQVTVTLNNSNFPWLSLDQSSLVITGKTPDSFLQGTVSPLSVPLTISPTGNDNTMALNTWLALDATPYFFTAFDLPGMDVKPKDVLSFDLKPYLNSQNPQNVVINATVTPKDAANWLVFYADDLTLSGTVPDGTKYSGLNVLFTASQGGFTATSDLAVTFSGVTAQPPYTAKNGTSMPDANNNGTNNGNANGDGQNNGNGQNGNNGNGDKGTSNGVNGNEPGSDSAPVPNASNGGSHDDGLGNASGLSTAAKIGIAVALGVVGLLILLAILFLCCCRRRKNKETEEEKQGHDDDGESFTVGSPDPSRTPRNFLGDIAKFSGFNMRSADPTPTLPPPVASPQPPQDQGDGQPKRLDGLRGIFGWGAAADEKEVNAGTIATPHLNRSDTSFMAQGDVIGVAEPVDRSPGMASSFTMSEASSGSLASWESGDSYNWSEEGTPKRPAATRQSMTPSIPRPREDFTPRYPRNNSPSRLAKLASQHTVGSHDESALGEDSGSGSGNHTLGTFSSSEISGSNFASRINMRNLDSEEDDTEGPAVVTMAERQSFATRHPTETRIPKLRPSKEHITSRSEQPPAQQSRRALAEVEEGMFDDAEEKRRSMVEAESGMGGLGYPAAAIYFGRPNSELDDRSSYMPSEVEAGSTTMKAIPANDQPLSPPLPHVGAVNRHRHRPSEPGILGDGRVLACANETFSIHPQIHPPPSAQMSGATWSSNPPSTYRAEKQEGGQIPGWLHFDARELELWGVPSLRNVGDVIDIKIIEKLPRDKKMANSSGIGYGPPQERTVGRLTIEVVDRISSPTVASPHAF